MADNDNMTYTSYLTKLIGAGSDAHKNLYKVEFTGILGSTDTSGSTDPELSVRCEGFTVPEFSQDTYTIKYITAFIDRPRAKLNYDRTFNISFRLDAGLKVYEALLAAQSSYMKDEDSFASNAMPTDDITVTLKVLHELDSTSTSDWKTLYTFKNCWITSIDTIGLDSGSSDPVKVQVTFRFHNVEYGNGEE